MFNYFFPTFPVYNEKPPTLYSLLNSIVNYGKEEKTKSRDLYIEGRNYMFDFDYPLSNNINKEDFEKMIINKFLMRRIGYETFTAFKLALDVKLNEIMPMYNKMFDAITEWDIFKDGEEITHTSETINNGKTDTTNQINTNSTTNSQNKEVNSDLPQNDLENIDSETYATTYTNGNTNSSDNSISNGSSSSENSNNTNFSETTKISQANKINAYNQFIKNKKNIYTMIFKDLESLFYGLV